MTKRCTYSNGQSTLIDGATMECAPVTLEGDILVKEEIVSENTGIGSTIPLLIVGFLAFLLFNRKR